MALKQKIWFTVVVYIQEFTINTNVKNYWLINVLIKTYSDVPRLPSDALFERFSSPNVELAALKGRMEDHWALSNFKSHVCKLRKQHGISTIQSLQHMCCLMWTVSNVICAVLQLQTFFPCFASTCNCISRKHCSRRCWKGTRLDGALSLCSWTPISNKGTWLAIRSFSLASCFASSGWAVQYSGVKKA